MDNDLPETDHCPGYGSVARYVATATLETTLDTRAMPETYPVKLLEVSGRYAGWIAAAGALARTADPTTPHLIYVPERPLVLEQGRFRIVRGERYKRLTKSRAQLVANRSS